MATSTAVVSPGTATESLPRSVTTPPAWLRILTPSFADFFFIALLVWLFICGPNGWKALLMDGDTGWHIRTGEYILTNHAVPKSDLFSFSRPAAPWFAWEWLTDVIFAALHRAAGLKGIVLFAGVLIVTYAAVILRYSIWRGAGALVATFATLLCVGGSSTHFLARPHLFTLLFFPIGIWLLEADRKRPSRRVWLLVPLSVLWINLHGGFFIFLACLALLVAGTGIEARIGRHAWKGARYGLLFVLCAAASLVNPYGIGLHMHVYEYLRAGWIRDLVQEFQAPTFRTEGQLQYEALLLVGLVLVGSLLRQKRITEALWIVFLAHSSLISVRHAPIFTALAAPLIAGEFTALWRGWAQGLNKTSALNIFCRVEQDLDPAFRRYSIWPAVVILGIAVVYSPVEWPTDFPSEGFPTTMVHHNEALLTSGRLLTTDQWGDYIIYWFYPRQQVFIDGRSDFYGEKLGNQYLHLLQGSSDWRRILKQYGFQVALLPANWPLATMLKLDPAWQLVQGDERAVLFQRRAGYALEE